METADRYLAFSNTGAGHWLTGMLGLPQPAPLARHRAGKPDVQAPVLLGAAPGGRLADAVAETLAGAGAATLYHAGSDVWREAAARRSLMTGRYDPDQSGKVGALVFDATGCTDIASTDSIHAFFHETVRALGASGRVVVLGTPPARADSAEEAAVQRGLEGFTRSLAKETRRGATVQLLYVEPGREGALASTLGFFLSPRSAYVSGQVVHVGEPVASGTSDAAAGRTVLVTGASRGIGEAIAETFARDGARVVALDVPAAADGLTALAGRIDGEALTLDVTAGDAAQRLVADAEARGGYDVVVHNAGITRDKTIARMDQRRWDAVMAVNLQAPLRITEALLAAGAFRRNGRMVAVSSLSGIAGNRGQTNYALSKAGVIGLVSALAPRAAEAGVTVNAVAPGFIETQMTAAVPFAIREAGRRMNAMGQGGLPVDVAETIAWLAHPGSGGVNGQVVRVCGQSMLGA